MITNQRKSPREYMELAIKVMKDSIHENRKDKSSPLVGAVLVFPDGTTDTACRGEFRQGDHAEYTLLDKKNRTKDLSGCWLFATLEPCAPGARNAPKIPCSERIVNARIAEVWFGIEDPDPKVDHGGIKHMQDNGVKVHQFDKDLHKEIEKFNDDFLTGAFKRKDEAQIAKQKPTDKLNKIAASTNFDNLSTEALQLFIEKSKSKLNVKSKEFVNELLQMELLETDKKTGENIPTGNAILLFGKNPRLKFPQASVKAKVTYGDSKTDVQSFDDALVLIPEQVEAWVKKVIPESFDRSKFIREKVPSFPIEVIDEAITNTIIHRDYSIEGVKVQLEITPDKIVVKSPGKPIPPIELKDLQNFTATSISRNKTLALVFNLMRYMEESGVGMDTYKEMRDKYKLPLPLITYEDPNLVVTFPRSAEAVRSLDNTEVLSQLNDEELAGCDFVKTQVTVTKKDYSEHFQFSEKKAQRHLMKFKELGLVTLEGKGPSSIYRYINNER
jgi:ATP-dependent DNA helicase RecG